jgi:small subunit ribosomal protein S19
MSKSKWKGPHITKNLTLKIFNKNNLGKHWNKKIWDRNLTISNSLVEKGVYVYNGKIFKRIVITRDKLGFKVGDFSFSRNYVFKKIIKKIAQKLKKK